MHDFDVLNYWIWYLSVSGLNLLHYDLNIDLVREG